VLRGAIVGLGNVAVQAHLPGWAGRDDVEIVGATDTRPARRTELHSRLPHARWYDSVDDLLERERPDFVDICTPPATHAALTQATLRRGAHVLCEKPLVASLDELRVVRRLASETGRVLFTVDNWRHAPILRRAHQLIERGEIGRLRRIRWETLRIKPAGNGGEARTWRADAAMAGGGILVDHGWHAFYLLQQWTGQTPVAIGARLETRQHTEWGVEDTATARLEFPDATGEVFLTWASDRRRNRIELEGTDGTILVDDDVLVLSPTERRRGELRCLYRPALSNGSYHPDWFQGVAAEFVAEVTGATRPGGNLAVASVCAVLQALARESSRRSGGMLRLAERGV
jgi:predicted dehydrogenase